MGFEKPQKIEFHRKLWLNPQKAEV